MRITDLSKYHLVVLETPDGNRIIITAVNIVASLNRCFRAPAHEK